MKKLTNVSPFLLLLVPVFMMIILTATSTSTVSDSDMANLKSGTNTSVAKLPAATFK